jgi:hypothetical protein
MAWQLAVLEMALLRDADYSGLKIDKNPATFLRE